MPSSAIPPHGPATPSTDHETTHQFWQRQRQQLERDARHLRWALPIAVLFAAGATVLRFPMWVGLAALALGITVATMGSYMIFVRRQEYDQKLRETAPSNHR